MRAAAGRASGRARGAVEVHEARLGCQSWYLPFGMDTAQKAWLFTCRPSVVQPLPRPGSRLPLRIAFFGSVMPPKTAQTVIRAPPEPALRDVSVLQPHAENIFVMALLLRAFFDQHYAKTQKAEADWQAGRAERSYRSMLHDLGVRQPALILDPAYTVCWWRLGTTRVVHVKVSLQDLLDQKLGYYDTDRCTLIADQIMARLAPARRDVRCLAAMILGRMSSLSFARALLAAVEHAVPTQMRNLLRMCVQVIIGPWDIRASCRKTVAKWTRKRARAYLTAVFVHCNKVRMVLQSHTGLRAVLCLRRAFGCLTAKNVQHMLHRHDLRARLLLACPRGPRSARGIAHLQGRSRSAVVGDRTGSQILTWHEDLEVARKKLLSCLRLLFPDLRRGTGKTQQSGEDSWLAQCPQARVALRDFARQLSLGDLDLQFLLCELETCVALSAVTATTCVSPLPHTKINKERRRLQGLTMFNVF